MILQGCLSDCPSDICVQSGFYEVELDDGSCCVCGEGPRAILLSILSKSLSWNGEKVTMSELLIGDKVQTGMKSVTMWVQTEVWNLYTNRGWDI